jgi:hypothetical protein
VIAKLVKRASLFFLGLLSSFLLWLLSAFCYARRWALVAKVDSKTQELQFIVMGPPFQVDEAVDILESRLGK